MQNSTGSTHPTYLDYQYPMGISISPSWITISGQSSTDIFKEKKKEDNLRYLYHVYIVNPKTGTIDHEAKVVAKDETQAMLKANIPDAIRDNLDEYDVIATVIGNVRPRKETQKVKVVTED